MLTTTGLACTPGRIILLLLMLDLMKKLFFGLVELNKKLKGFISKNGLSMVAKPFHFDAAPAPALALELHIFFTALEPALAPAPTYLLHAGVS